MRGLIPKSFEGAFRFCLFLVTLTSLFSGPASGGLLSVRTESNQRAGQRGGISISGLRNVLIEFGLKRATGTFLNAQTLSDNSPP